MLQKRYQCRQIPLAFIALITAYYRVYSIVRSGTQHACDNVQSAFHSKVETIAVNVVHFTGKKNLQEYQFSLVFEFDEFNSFVFHCDTLLSG